MYRPHAVLSGVCMLMMSMQAAHADLPFLKETAGDAELPSAYGIGVDYYFMDQDYDVESLEVAVPGLTVDDPSVILVDNEVEYVDVKIDAWIFPFLNLFAVLGTLNGETTVDLGRVDSPQLPFPLGTVDIDYDGTVYGIGLTTVYGRDNWFGSMTATYTDTDLDGDFDSTVRTFTFQPRFGMRYSNVTAWIGATFLDAEENHSGTLSLGIPDLPPVPFDVELSSANEWNMTLGARVQITEHLEATLDFGFSGRKHRLANVTWRF